MRRTRCQRTGGRRRGFPVQAGAHPARDRERTSKGLYPDKNRGVAASCRWKQSRRNRNSRHRPAAAGRLRLAVSGNGSAEPAVPAAPLPGTRNARWKGLGRRLSGKAPATYGRCSSCVHTSKQALAALEDYWSRRRRQSARGDGDRNRQERRHRSPDPRHLATLSSTASPGCDPCARLIEQDLEHLLALWPDAPSESTARASASANGTRRSSSPGVQSVWRNAARLGPRHLVLIDEAHLVPHDGDGMYRSLLSELRALVPPGDMRVAGFSATPFRLDTGRLDEGEGKIFDDVVFDYGIGQGIRDGWLSPLTSKADQGRDQHQQRRPARRRIHRRRARARRR